MQRIRSLALLLTAFAGTVVLVAAPVAADTGSDSGSGSGDSSTSQTSDSNSTDSNSTDTQSTDQAEPSDSSSVHDELTKLRQDAKDSLQQMREQHHSDLTAKGRQLACEKRQAGIDNRISNYAAEAQRHLNVFTGIFTKVQNFYASKKLNVSNYDTLVAAVTAKQTAAQSAVDALKALSVNIDCTQPDPAQTLEAVKGAVSDARTALQAYRAAIKDLIVAIGNTLDTQAKSTGGNQ